MNHASLTGGRVLARNTIFNLIGSLAPLLVAFFAVPALVGTLGTERFGVLSLIWMVVGYFSLFDLGIGRATTKYVAENLARRETDLLPGLIWSSLGMLLLFGMTGTLLLSLLTPYLLSHCFNIPAYLTAETSRSFYLIAAALPLVLGTAGARGILEAQQRFALINAIKIPVSVGLFALPLAVVIYSKSLFPITVALIGVRLIECAAYALCCLRSIPGIGHPHWPNREYARKLLGFGGWLTVTNIVGPLMTYMDRFLIGGMLTMSAVTYYSTPYDFIMRLAVIPGSLLAVMFPALAASFAQDVGRFNMLYDRTVLSILCIMTPAVLILTVIAHPFLTIWLGKEFAAQSTLVFQILSIGILVNSLGLVPYVAIQAMGRPDLTAKIHLMELPLYLAMIWMLTLRLGIVGASLAWLIRVAIDTALLTWLARRMMPVLQGELEPHPEPGA